MASLSVEVFQTAVTAGKEMLGRMGNRMRRDALAVTLKMGM